MSRPSQILLVAPQAKLVNTLSAWLRGAGHDVIVASTFPEAKPLLALHPDLLITALKLDEYNGLQLALRAGGDGIPAVVVGPSDRVLERDARDLGAVYLSNTLHRAQLIDLVEELLTRATALVLMPHVTQAMTVAQPSGATHAWRPNVA